MIQVHRAIVEGSNAQKLYCSRFQCKDLGLSSRYILTLEGRRKSPLDIRNFRKVLIKIESNQCEAFYQAELLAVHQHLSIKGDISYRLQFGCSLHRLDNFSHQRVFVNKNIEAILRALLTSHGIEAHFELEDLDTCRPYVAQGGVSDYDFLYRLCAESGIVFYYRHHDKCSVLHFTNSLFETRHFNFHFNPASQMVTSEAAITSLHYWRINTTECVRLREAQELEPEIVFEQQSRNTTGVPAHGVLNVSHHVTINNEKECEQKATFLQQQLDWQRECVQVDFLASDIQPADVLKIHNHQDPRINLKSFRILTMDGSMDASNKTHAHPFRFRAWLIPVDRVYKMPFYPSQIKTLTKLPSQFTQSINFPIPALQKALIQGNKNEITMDEQGRYPVRPLLTETLDCSPYFRQLQSAAGPVAGKPQGIHWPLFPETEVILAHLNNHIDKPVILGVVPGKFQDSPVTENNSEHLTMNHASGCVFRLDDTKQYQRLRLHTKNPEHGLELLKKENHEFISAKSSGSMDISAHQSADIKAGMDIVIKGNKSLLEAREALNLGSKKETAAEAGKITHKTGGSWHAQADECLSLQSKKQFRLNAQRIGLRLNQINIQSGSSDIKANAMISLLGGQGIRCQAGASHMLVANQMTFKAAQIILAAPLIIKNQGITALVGSTEEQEISGSTL